MYDISIYATIPIGDIIENSNKTERVLTVGTNLGAYPYDLDNSMKELSELVYAAGGEVIIETTQNMDKFNPKYLIGPGKVDEIKEICESNEIDTVVFNDELTGIQLRNLNDAIKKKVVDRTNLILDIFALRATTYEAKLQVKMAALEYELPRLLGIKGWSRTGGGIGTRGPGEQIIETDRRRLKREIDSIKDKLKKAKQVRATTGKDRRNSDIPIVTLVGYTNAGKSTILNKLKDEESKEVFVKDMLFATLDASTRSATLPNNRPYLISDTVGFVSKLPTKLVEAFKSTLEEIKYSDLILHVIDLAGEDLVMEYNTTMEILKDIGIEDKKILTVFNKKDLVELETIVPPGMDEKKIYISAKSDEDILKLKEEIEVELQLNLTYVKGFLPYNALGLLEKLRHNFTLKDIEYTNDGAEFIAHISNKAMDEITSAGGRCTKLF